MTKELRDTIIQLFTEKIQQHERALRVYEASYGHAAHSKRFDRQTVAEKKRLESLLNDFTSQNRIIKTLLDPVDAGSYAKTADDLRKSGFCPWDTCMKQQSKPQQDAATDEDALRDIVKRYGIPLKVYVDLGDYPSRASRNEETAADEKSHPTETGEKTVLDRTFGEVKESFMRLYDSLFVSNDSSNS